MTIYSSDTTYNNNNAILSDENVPDIEIGEQCTYKIAEEYKIAEDNKFDVSIISKTDQDKINKYIDDKEYSYSLCDKINDNFVNLSYLVVLMSLVWIKILVIQLFSLLNNLLLL